MNYMAVVYIELHSVSKRGQCFKTYKKADLALFCLVWYAIVVVFGNVMKLVVDKINDYLVQSFRGHRLDHEWANRSRQKPTNADPSLCLDWLSARKVAIRHWTRFAIDAGTTVCSRRWKWVQRVIYDEQYRACRDYLTPPMHATESVKSDSGLTW